MRSTVLDRVPAEALVEFLATDGDVLVVSNAERGVEWVAPSVTDLLGWTPSEFIVVAPTLVHPDDADVVAGTVGRVRTFPGFHEGGRARFLTSKGTWRTLRFSYCSLVDTHDVVVTRYRRVDDGPSPADDLTGLPRRAEFLRLLEERVDAGEQVSVLFCDLDDFKIVNDANGHAAGDRVLTAVANRISAVLPDGAFAARWGGDEFVVAARTDDVADIVRRVQRAVAAPLPVRAGSVSVGCTIGVAHAGWNSDASTLIEMADAEMYRHKSGRRVRSS